LDNPEHISIRREGHETIIRYRPRTPNQRVVLFSLLLFGVVVTIAGILAEEKLFFLSLGFGFLYFAAALLLGKCEFRVGRKSIMRRYGPLPMLNRKTAGFASVDITQLFIRKVPHRGKQRAFFQLHARYKDGTDACLIEQEVNFRALAELEAALEASLDLRNDPSLDLSGEGFTLSELTAKAEAAKSHRALLNSRAWVPAAWKDAADQKIIAARIALEKYQDRRAGGSGKEANKFQQNPGVRPPAKLLAVKQKIDHLELSFRSRDRNASGVTAWSFMIIWGSLIVAVVLAASGLEPLAQIVFAGGTLTYFAYLYRSRERTVRTRVYQHKFSVATGYLTVGEEQFFSNEGIGQFYVHRQAEGKNGNISYALSAEQRFGPNLLIIDGVENVRYLLELEEQLEHALDITDNPAMSISVTGQNMSEMEHTLDLYQKQYNSLRQRPKVSQRTVRQARERMESAEAVLEHYYNKLG